MVVWIVSSPGVSGGQLVRVYDSAAVVKEKMAAAKADSAYKHTYIYIITHRPANDSNAQLENFKRGDGKLRNTRGKAPYYFAYLFLIGFIFLAIIKLSDTGLPGKLFTSVYNTRQLFNMFSEGRFGFNSLNISLDAIFILSFGILIQQLFYPYHPEYFIWVFVFITGAYYLKLILIQLCAYLFFDQLDALVHVLFNLLFTRLMGLILLPVVFISIYQEYIVSAGLLHYVFILVLLAYIGWLLRLLIKMKLEGVSGIFYLILYLCAIETFPILILLKTFLA